MAVLECTRIMHIYRHVYSASRELNKRKVFVSSSSSLFCMLHLSLSLSHFIARLFLPSAIFSGGNIFVILYKVT